MKNALTIDVEDWYQTQDFNFDLNTWDNYDDRVMQSTEKILELLQKYNVCGTFFILGWVAKKHPGLVRRIAEHGHEIGSHGSYHKMVTSQTQEEFRSDVLYSKKLLEDITGKKVELFRASSWSINSETLWALQVLQEEGFICDSSIQPFKTPLSGMNRVPITPFRPIINNQRLKIIEFPSSALNFSSYNIPFSGGFYLRFLPYLFISQALKKVNRKRPGMIYVHPWEVDIKQTNVNADKYIKIFHNYNIDTTYKKLEKLLQNFEFVTVSEIIKEQEYPYVLLT